MTSPLQYDSAKGPLQVLSVHAVPTVVTLRIAPVGPGFRNSADGRIPHVLYTTGLGLDTRPIVAEGPSYDDPLAYRFDAAGTIALPYLGTLYIVGGNGIGIVTPFVRRSQERDSPTWPMPPQRWSLSQGTDATTIRFVPPMGSESLSFGGSGAAVGLVYDAAVENYLVTNQDRLSLAGVTTVSYTPTARGQAIIRGWL